MFAKLDRLLHAWLAVWLMVRHAIWLKYRLAGYILAGFAKWLLPRHA
jgi:hypothetical protein